MPGMTERLSQRLAIPGAAIYPLSQGAGNVLTGSIDMRRYARVMFIVVCGVLGTSATVDAKIRSSATSGGTYADVSGKAITQLVKASNDNNIAIVECKADELPSGQPFVKLSVDVGTNASLICVIPLVGDARYHPASDDNVAAVVQVLA